MRAFVLILLALVSCSNPPIELETPASSAASRIIAVERETSVLQVIAVEGAAGGLQPITDYGGEPVRLTILDFEQPLAELGLTAGPLEHAPDGALLLDLGPTEISVLEVRDGEASPWTSAPLSPALSERRVSRREVGCVEFSAVRTRIDTPNIPSFVLSMNDEEAYAGDHGGRLFVVRRDGSSREVTPPASWLPPGVIELPSAGAVRERDDVVWLAGYSQLLRVRIGPDLTPGEILEHHPIPIEGRYRFVAGGPLPGGRFELFLRSVEGAFVHFDGTRFELLHQFRYDPMADWRGGVIWRGPGEGWAVSNLAEYVAIQRDGSLTLELPSDARNAGLTSIASIGGAVLISDGESLIHRFTDRWEVLGASGSDVGADFIAPFAGGFLYGGRLGTFGQWRDDRGFCPPLTPITGHSIRFFAYLGATLLVAGPAVDTNFPFPITLLTPR